jgi:acyl-coenzyme A synthetase/AMP-(fatty) acid ligase
MTIAKRGYSGELPPARFNMARYCLQAAARTTPNKVALIVVSDAHAPVEQAERWTYAQLDDAVRRIAAGLRQMDLMPGARIMIRMGNTSDYALLFFGAIAGGYAPLPSSAQLTAEEADFLLADSGARLLAVSGRTGDPAAAGSADAQSRRSGRRCALGINRWTMPTPPPPIRPSWSTPPAPAASPRACCTPSVRPGAVARCTRAGMGSSADDVMLHAGAFNWTYTLGVGLTDPLGQRRDCGACTTARAMSPSGRYLHGEIPGHPVCGCTQGLYRQMLKYNDLASFDLSSLRHGLTAGEALQPALLQQWRTTTGKELYEALGMSECSTYISTAPGAPIKVGSPGGRNRAGASRYCRLTAARTTAAAG